MWKCRNGQGGTSAERNWHEFFFRLVHAKVREPHLNPRFVRTFLTCPFKSRVRGGKFARTRGFRCGSRTFVWTSHVADWIAGGGTETLEKRVKNTQIIEETPESEKTKEMKKTKKRRTGVLFTFEAFFLPLKDTLGFGKRAPIEKWKVPEDPFQAN